MIKPKVFFFLVGIALTTSHIFAQAPNGHFTEWGNVTPAELDMKECSFQKDADAELLMDLAQVYYEKVDAKNYSQGRFLVTTAYYQRYKVFTEAGLRKANRYVRFRNSKGDSVTDIRAICYNPGGEGQMEITQLSSADIHYTKSNEYETEVAFAVPGVKKGSVFELTYKKTQYVNYTLPNWYFKADVPSAYGRLSIGFLDAIEYHVDEHIYDTAKFKIERTPFQSGISVLAPSGQYEYLQGTLVTYTTTNLPGFKNEPYTNSSSNYMDRIAFQLKAMKPPLSSSGYYITTFETLAYHMMHDHSFGGNLSDPPIPAKYWKSVVREGMPMEQGARALYEYIRSNMDWNGGAAIYSSQDIATTWKLKTGNSADINFLLLNTMRAAGLTVYPAIVTNRSEGYFNKDYPMFDDMNDLMVMLELEGGKKRILLDASDKFLPFGLIGYSQLNNYGIVIDGESSYYLFDTYNLGDNTENTLISAAMDNTGEMKGSMESTFDNYSQASFRRYKASDRRSALAEHMKQRISATVVSSNDTVDAANSLFIRRVQFTSQPMNDDGNIYVALSSVYGETENPFTSAERSSDVDFGYRPHIHTTMQLQLPKGYELDPATKPQSLATPDSSIRFSYTTTVKNDTLYIEQRLDYTRSLYLVKEYPAFYAFHHDYYKLMQQPVVLRKRP